VNSFSAIASICASICLAMGAEPSGSTPVQMVVTVEARHGHEVPVLGREDFLIREGGEKLQVTDAVRLQGDNGDLELFILLDDASQLNLGSQLGDVRRFIDAQSERTAIGIGYMRNGTVDIRQGLTRDHGRAAKALRLPIGTGSSPYLSLSELVKHWAPAAARREVLMLTSGADPLGGEGVENPYLDVAIADAQRAGIIVYAIYTAGEGHSAHSYWRMNWGRDYLAKLADETGGEAYVVIPGAPPSIAPYLAEVAGQLNHQYRVAFPAGGEGKPALKSIKLTTEVPNAEIVAASKVYVPSVSVAP
jgi:hypothetical protein